MLGGILRTLHTPLAVITNRHCRNFVAPTQPFGRNVEPSIHAAIWSTSFVNWKLLTSWHVGFYRCTGTRPNTGEIRTWLGGGSVQSHTNRARDKLCLYRSLRTFMNFLKFERTNTNIVWRNPKISSAPRSFALRNTNSRDVNYNLIQWDLHFPSYLWLIIRSNHLHELLSYMVKRRCTRCRNIFRGNLKSNFNGMKSWSEWTLLISF